MNCQEFETIVHELVRESVIEAEARDDALGHCGLCPKCATRLADEQALTAGLRAMAAGKKTVQAPERLEAVLRAAFRDYVVASNSFELEPDGARRSYRSRWYAATAAATLLLSIGLSTRLKDDSKDVSLQHRAPSATWTQDLAEPKVTRLNPKPVRPKRASERRPAARAVAKRSNHFLHPNKLNTPVTQNHSTVGPWNNAGEYEIVTDFFPMIYGEYLPPLEGGQMVRVRLPRSALLKFGLPMNVERADESIKADVVVGEDGLARAIRFVR